jgi:hypothetical protein
MKYFLVTCRVCAHRHRMAWQKCPSCGVYEVPQPISEGVQWRCGGDYACDGCLAYREHQA